VRQQWPAHAAVPQHAGLVPHARAVQPLPLATGIDMHKGPCHVGQHRRQSMIRPATGNGRVASVVLCWGAQMLRARCGMDVA
jgi:hypothetical protein